MTYSHTSILDYVMKAVDTEMVGLLGSKPLKAFTRKNKVN